jgi:hypothetical protein
MGNLKIAGPVTCMEHGACKQTKLVYCYNIRKIQTTAINKKWLLSGRELPPPTHYNGFHGRYMHGKQSLKEDSKAAKMLGYGGTKI